MDGDAAPLQELVELKHRYQAGLIVDEAHGGGVYGPNGQGLAAELDVAGEIDVHIGTFSKSFGIYGAYAACNETTRRWLINKARPLIYSTALPPAVTAGAKRALELIVQERWRSIQARSSALTFREQLRSAGLRVEGKPDCPIVPLIVGDSQTALRFSAALEQEGIAASAIRPPTVPADTARIRFSLSAAHTEQDLQEAIDAIARIAVSLGVGQ
jgi:8-amino-7-oxononanoate synthase